MVFIFGIGGHFGPSFDLVTKNGSLICTCISRGANSQVSLPLANNESWNKVVQFLLTRKWKRSYNDMGVLDGTSWTLAFRFEGFSLRSSGSNAYPPGFQKFLRLLNQVLVPKGITVY